MLTKRILGNTGKAESEDLLQEKQLKDEEFRSGLLYRSKVAQTLVQQCLYVFVVQYETIALVIFKTFMWNSSLEPTRVTYKYCTCCRNLLRCSESSWRRWRWPACPESARQAVNHVWSFICQSPPKCHAVRMDNFPQHRHTATSSCLSEWLSVSRSQRSQFGPSDSCTSTEDDVTLMTSAQHLTGTG